MVDMLASGGAFAPLYVELVVIKNFRGLRQCAIELEQGLTVIVGPNNAGKTRILRALGLALGALPAELDDLTVGSEEPATIDVVIAPPPPTTENDDEIFADAVTQRLGGVQVLREEPLRERFAWRTTIHRSAEGLGARAEMQPMTFDSVQRIWTHANNALFMSREQRSLFAADLVESHRDLVEELSRRGSAIRRVFSDLEVEPSTRETLEGQLTALNAEIVDSSITLDAVRRSLEEGQNIVGALGNPSLSPLPVRLEELARSVAIDLDSGNGALPARLHGAGARSLASLQVQGVLYDRRLGRDGPSLRPHPMTLIEEPEAHLHPQAVLELADLLTRMRGQLVVTTHSSHLVTTIEPRSIRMVRQQNGEVKVVDLGPVDTDSPNIHRALRPSTQAAEMEKLKRQVERPFGELLFSQALVVGDGATERAFLPIVLRHALGRAAHGICVVDSNNLNGPLAIAAIKFAQLADIPWVIFSDSDEAGQAAVASIMRTLNIDISGEAPVVWVVGEASFGDKATGAIERMLSTFDESLCREACLELRPDLDETRSTDELLKQLKGTVGGLLARKLVERYDDPSAWPHSVCELVSWLQHRLLNGAAP